MNTEEENLLKQVDFSRFKTKTWKIIIFALTIAAWLLLPAILFMMVKYHDDNNLIYANLPVFFLIILIPLLLMMSIILAYVWGCFGRNYLSDCNSW